MDFSERRLLRKSRGIRARWDREEDSARSMCNRSIYCINVMEEVPSQHKPLRSARTTTLDAKSGLTVVSARSTQGTCSGGANSLVKSASSLMTTRLYVCKKYKR